MRIRTALMTVIGGVCLAAPAYAEPGDADTALLTSLQAAGITYTNADQVIVTAKLVCELIAEGKPSPQVLEGLKSRNPGLTTEHGAQFVGIAAQVYCPDQLVRNGVAGTT
ncbi:DUF732 domain-containing protein [Mycolicibacter hiberniae]|uniref:Uncharacterized protein n=1 Tax=Mycolicibacter hiberniae TaxID=29314 RepID=A0A7I7X074_9MYCO|nr:DUF732 domain-containing protein [Mycolicibacter hiberniae]ORV67015.1 hypothetical protein AWC09_19070 [Mycolicibacter hiberniae]BBZ22257.1 hypothetical protein MHIB_06750 [Mycolicibacter hiberniae]